MPAFLAQMQLNSSFLVQFELIRGPDLLEYLEQCGGRIPEALAQFCFQQLVSAVGHMHKLNFCHRDLKLENLMLDLHQQCLKVRHTTHLL